MRLVTVRLVLVLATLVALAAMTILGGYNLRIRSYPVDIDLSSPRRFSAAEQAGIESRR
ncbi:hypothetical protein HY522_09770 [bacterium]|nr:hypothetical protein [bacterium]